MAKTIEQIILELANRAPEAFKKGVRTTGGETRNIERMKPEEVQERIAVEEDRIMKMSKDWSQSASSVAQGGLNLAKQNVNTGKALLALLDVMKADSISKGWGMPTSPVTGPISYDLERPMKLLYPVFSPIRNITPRVPGEGTATNWRAVVSINDNWTGVGLSEGSRGGTFSARLFSMTAVYRSIGLENYVTFEMDSSSQGYQDVKALAMLQTMQALMMAEELLLIGGIGNPQELGTSTFALGTAGTPTVVANTTTGTLANAAYYVRVVALSMEATRIADFNCAVALPTVITRTNIDGTTTLYNGGCSKASASGTATPTLNQSLLCTTAAKPNAYAYAWFISSDDTTFYMAKITNVNRAILSSPSTANAQLPADLVTNDRSANILVFDGIWTQANGALAAYINPATVPGGNNYYQGTLVSQSGSFPATTPLSLDGAAFTSDGAGGITEINNLFQTTYNLSKFGIQTLYGNANVLKQMSSLVIANGGAPLYRIMADGSRNVTGGFQIPDLINPYFAANGTVKTIIHPYLPDGVLLGHTTTLPYAMSNVGNLSQVKTRRETYATQWPLRTRQYEYGVYAEELAECYFPPAFPSIINIGPNTTPQPIITMGDQPNIVN